MGYVILLWHSLSLPYNYLEQVTFTPCLVLAKHRKRWTDDRHGQTVTRLGLRCPRDLVSRPEIMDEEMETMQESIHQIHQLWKILSNGKLLKKGRHRSCLDETNQMSSGHVNAHLIHGIYVHTCSYIYVYSSSAGAKYSLSTKV